MGRVVGCLVFAWTSQYNRTGGISVMSEIQAAHNCIVHGNSNAIIELAHLTILLSVAWKRQWSVWISHTLRFIDKSSTMSVARPHNNLLYLISLLNYTFCHACTVPSASLCGHAQRAVCDIAIATESKHWTNNSRTEHQQSINSTTLRYAPMPHISSTIVILFPFCITAQCLCHYDRSEQNLIYYVRLNGWMDSVEESF